MGGYGLGGVHEVLGRGWGPVDLGYRDGSGVNEGAVCGFTRDHSSHFLLSRVLLVLMS